jgi:hypothetical protein
MDDGRLPFRYVGAHRRCRLQDVLALRKSESVTRQALQDLAADTEELITEHGL